MKIPANQQKIVEAMRDGTKLQGCSFAMSTTYYLGTQKAHLGTINALPRKGIIKIGRRLSYGHYECVLAETMAAN